MYPKTLSKKERTQLGTLFLNCMLKGGISYQL